MRLPLLLGALLATAAVSLPGASASAQMSCSEHREICETICTPDRVARYYFGVARRCTASCEPRWQQCLRSGLWVDLERRTSGGTEYARRF